MDCDSSKSGGGGVSTLINKGFLSIQWDLLIDSESGDVKLFGMAALTHSDFADLTLLTALSS